MDCPVCGSKQIGKVGVNQFYCWNCFVEFNDRNQIFQVAEDGALIAFEEADALWQG
ncbi:hypothetical protein [Heliophilum fasciatum]|uniref:Uncharacterized protein n=1 Tax=Heliophilum fasciatum TaxID=35700 RepID=A0A4R2RMZ2_9FIRM|nr:hypothetical protein [Heliophilum fasciatum]MCW2278042.1 hypothetical protein [Heliophilum fasciatum]TCP64338.1 hypothetical protein EDD73_11037 [Heliophilum fasciatum]